MRKAREAALEAAVRADDQATAKELAGWRQLRGDEQRKLSGLELTHEVGAALGVRPNHEPKTEADKKQLEEGTWPFYEGDSLKAVETVSAALRKASGNGTVSLGVMPYALRREGETSHEMWPLFRVDGPNGQRFIDHRGWTYDSLDKWRNENKLEPGKVTFPKDGLLSAPGKTGPSELVSVSTPSVIDTPRERLIAIADKVAMVGGMALGAAAVIGTGGLPVLIGGAALALYSGGRSGASLYDAHKHGQNVLSAEALKDPQLRSQWLNVAASALGLGAMGASAGAVSKVVASGLPGKALGAVAPALMVGSQVAGTAVAAQQAVDLATNWDQLSPQDKLLTISQLGFFAGGSARQARAMGGYKNLYSFKAYQQALRPLDAQITVGGDGIAGAAASAKAAELGKTSIIAEPRDRSGGRAWNDPSKLGEPFDKGPSFIHTSDQSPLTQIALDAGVKLRESNITGPLYLGDRMGTSAETEAFTNTMYEVEKAIKSTAARGDFSADTGLPTGLPFQNIAEASLHTSMVAAEPSKVSAVDAAGHNISWIDSIPEGNGMGDVWKAVAGDHPEVTRQLNTKITDVRTYPDRVEIDTVSNGKKNTLHSRAHVMTAPSGVLQSGMINFDPPLPVKTQNAIDNLPMGDLNKVAMKFDANYFGDQENIIMTHANPDGTDTMWFHVRPLGTNVVHGFIAGEEAFGLTQLPPEASLDRALGTLSKMFPEAQLKDKLVAWDSTNWRKDPYALGSYSYATPGNAQARWDIAQPVDNKLWFAGEHVGDPKWAITATGALLTGQEAAKGAAAWIDANPPDPSSPVPLSRDQLGPRAMRPGTSAVALGATSSALEDATQDDDQR